MFHQAAYQPQVVAALTQVSALLNSARQGSTAAVYPKHGRTSRVSSKRTSKAQVKTKTKNSVKEQKEEIESCIADLARNINMKEICPLLGLSTHENRVNSSWRTSYVSANTFFENKTGFPEQMLSVAGPSVRSLYSSPEFRQLLTRCIEQKYWPVCEQRRLFMNEPRSSVSGMGIDHHKHDKTGEHGSDTAHAEGLSIRKGQKPKLSWLGKQNEAVQQQVIAFAEGYAGYTGKEENKTKETAFSFAKSALRVLVILICLVIITNVLLARRAGPGIGAIFTQQNFETLAEEVNVNFSDVKGVDEAKAELQDIVEYLKDPEKYRAMGAKLPKGVLLVGSPGIGKTLLARAVAGEAGVHFFHASGSEFDEVFVGSGSRKVRQLFAAAKAKAPSVIFLDEIDSVGAKRTSSQIHPYANQTINQLLSEMDGFTANEGVIVLGATNRRDNLDSALTRPGRFDVEVNVLPPDFKGRKEIFRLYLGKVKTSKDIDLEKLAHGSRGMTGADIENIVNQAALKAAREKRSFVTMEHLDFARDKVLMGPAWKNKIDDEETNWYTAYHEAGHTLVAFFTKDATPLHKVTILPRGQSLGHTAMMEEKEMYNKTKSHILAEMDVSMGGRVAEELIYGPEKVTTGAGADFQSATRLATAMVKQLGMSEKVGCRVYGSADIDSGFAIIKKEDISPAQQEMIDNEISRLLNESYERAKALLKKHEAEHKRLAAALMKYETLTKEEIANIINNKKLKV